jgi:aarF domain-containing kinase
MRTWCRFYLKQAQLMSIRDDFVPPQYLEWCKKMQDSAPVPLDEATARSIFETSLGRRVEEVFSVFNWTPIGSASIGQVYRATLHNGRDVAVKVQVPGIEDSFRADLNTARAFCRLALPQFVKSLDETERQFLTEFDYTREANNLDVVADNIMPAWGGRVVVPRPVHGLCTRDVLVMDYLPGVKLVDGVRASYAQYAERTGTTLEDLERQELAMMQSADYRHRTLDDAARRTRLLWYYLRATDCAYNAARLVYNWTAGWVAAPRSYQWCDPPVNLAEV